MAYRRKTWNEKMDPPIEPKIEVDVKTGLPTFYATPRMVAAEVQRVRKGRLITPAMIRERLAEANGAADTSPITTGIFLTILSGAVEEDLAEGRRPQAPYWRVVEDNGRLREKNRAGVERQRELLEAEGHVVEPQGRAGKLTVVDFQKRLV